ncbi:hypothetical protein O3M35_006994 [Rhynocoris fuscipes]|uniref:HMG box domain-containing protein n=1 Tax=Rhynocoris fuscipes TaxID=488301 RepID=A0AAW1DFH6_9HEMI
MDEDKETKATTATKKKTRKPKTKKVTDPNKPKRPPSAYLLWTKENRDRIKEENPGITFLELSKKAGEMWKAIEDKSKWLNKAKELRSEYFDKKKLYEGGDGDASGNKA